MAADQFTLTTGGVSRASGVCIDSVRQYADMQLVTHIRLDDRRRLFRPSAVQEVAEIRRQRLAQRGGRRTPQ